MGAVVEVEFRHKRILTPRERLQALLLATLDEESASFCTKHQSGLRELLEANAKMLRRLAQ